MSQMYALVSDKDRQLLLRHWLEIYFEELGKRTNVRLPEIDQAAGITEDTRRAWFKEDFGQQVLAEFKTDLSEYSATRLTMLRHRYLDRVSRIAVGEDITAEPKDIIQASRFLEEVHNAVQAQGETQPVGRIGIFLNLYAGKTTPVRAEEDPVEAEVRVISP